MCYCTRVPSLPVFGCLVGSPVMCPPSSLAAAVSELTADVWLSMDLLLLLMCPLPTSMLVPTVVVVVSPTVASGAEVHSWPVCPSLLQTEQCLQCWRHSSRSSCLQQPLLVGQCGGQVLLLSVPTRPSQPALGGVCCHSPVVPLR